MRPVGTTQLRTSSSVRLLSGKRRATATAAAVHHRLRGGRAFGPVDAVPATARDPVQLTATTPPLPVRRDLAIRRGDARGLGNPHVRGVAHVDVTRGVRHRLDIIGYRGGMDGRIGHVGRTNGLGRARSRLKTQGEVRHSPARTREGHLLGRGQTPARARGGPDRPATRRSVRLYAGAPASSGCSLAWLSIAGCSVPLVIWIRRGLRTSG